jgi:tetratricopeptide (TPR) repeat protein
METPMSVLPEHWPRLSSEVAGLFETEAEQHPTWADVQNRWGLTLLTMGRFGEARDVFERALKRNPRYAWAAMNHVQTLALLGEGDLARVRLSDAPWPARGCKEFTEAFLALCEETTFPVESWAGLGREISGRPDFVRLRVAVQNASHPEDAQNAWEKLRSAFPGPLPGWVNPLNTRTDLPHWLLSFVPGLYQLMKDASTWEARLGRAADAAAFAHAMPVFWYDLGAAWCQQGFLANLAADEAGALESYQRAADASPASPEPWIALAYLWSAAGDLAQADEALRQSLDRAPGYADLHYQRGLLDHARGDMQGALRSFRAALKQNPDYVVARMQEAETLFELKEWEGARSSFLRVVNAGLESVDVWLRLGETEEELHRIAQAEVAYRRAAELDPQSALPHFHLGRLHRDRGDREKAKRAWRRFLALAGDSEEAAAVKAELEEGETR